MIRTKRSNDFLCSLMFKSDSIEQITKINAEIDRSLEQAGNHMNWAEKHRTGYYDYNRFKPYQRYKEMYHEYQNAMRNLGGAHDIANYFANHFLCSAHMDNRPSCFMDYLFESQKQAREGYSKVYKMAKKALHKAAKLRLKGKHLPAKTI